MTRLRTSIYKMFELVLLPWAERASNQTTLRAIRSALIVTLPLLMLGSLGELLNSFPLPAYKLFMTAHFGEYWMVFCQSIRSSTFAIMSLITLFSISQHLADNFNTKNFLIQINPVIAGLVSFVSFICLLAQDMDTGLLTNKWLGVSGLFVAIIVALVSSRLFLFLLSIKKLRLYLPGGTPDVAIQQAFDTFLPGMLTALVFIGLGTFIHVAGDTTLPEITHDLIRIPFDYIGDGLSRGILYILSLHILWFFGIHGANVLDPITHDIYGAAIAANQAAAAAGLPLPHVMTKTFMDTFVFMGGAGTSICLIAALILFGKTQANRKLGIISLIPGIFNINEVLLFGLPIVLNPLMFIPFIVTPLLLAAISYVAVSMGIVPGTSITAEWTTPVLLNGYLSTGSIRGLMLQAFNLMVGTLFYAPFVMLSNKINQKRIETAFKVLLERSCAASESSMRCIDYHDDAGSVARNLLTDLEHDLREDKGIYLEYQPKVSASDEKVVSVEALVRWRHESYGSIPAPITITLAEESGLIIPLGLKVFRNACQTNKTWRNQGISDITMGVNFSALQLTKNLPRQLMEILFHYDLLPSMFEIEVTESSALDTNKPESRVLTSLYEMGFQIAIDDFGMGHTSLKYLRQFPVTSIKIDGSITKEVVMSSISMDIISSIIKLCKARNMISVAEFVDNDEQANLLRDLGCDVFQGYKYSKPLSANVCLEFIHKNIRHDGI